MVMFSCFCQGAITMPTAPKTWTLPNFLHPACPKGFPVTRSLSHQVHLSLHSYHSTCNGCHPARSSSATSIPPQSLPIRSHRQPHPLCFPSPSQPSSQMFRHWCPYPTLLRFLLAPPPTRLRRLFKREYTSSWTVLVI